MAKIIVAITPFHGHVGPLLTVTSALLRRGHDVLVWTGDAFAAQTRATGARFAALPREVDFDGRNMAGAFPEFAALGAGPAMHEFFWKRVFLDAVHAQYRGLRRLLREFPARVVIHDQVFLGAFPFVLGKEQVQRPVTISLGCLPPTLLSKDAVPFALGAAPEQGDAEPERVRELNALARQTYAGLQKHAEGVFGGLGIRLEEFIFTSMIAVPDHYLQLSVPGFEYPRSDFPATFRFVGALPMAPTPDYQEPDWWPELDSARHVVVVTQGTLANDDLSELIVPTIQGLAGLNVLVVVATAREDGPEDVRRLLGAVPVNTRLAGYVPFDRLLPFASVLVTNGGYGGVHTALYNGVPLVVAGDTEDKLDVSARVQWSGVGVDLRTGHPTASALREAVAEILREPRYRQRAGQMRVEFSRYQPLGAIGDLVDCLSAPMAGTAS